MPALRIRVSRREHWDVKVDAAFLTESREVRSRDR